MGKKNIGLKLIDTFFSSLKILAGVVGMIGGIYLVKSVATYYSSMTLQVLPQIIFLIILSIPAFDKCVIYIVNGVQEIVRCWNGKVPKVRK